MNDDDIYTGLQQIFGTVFRGRRILISPDLAAKDVPGWDSFRHVSIIMATEEYFGIRLMDDDIDALANVGDLAKAVADKVRGGR